MGKMCKVVVCLCMAVLSWGGADAEIGHNMNNISLSMLDEVTDVMDMVEVVYSEPVITAKYVAELQFDMRAMGPLYNSTHIIIDAIADKQAYPEGIVSVSDGHLYVAPLKDEWRPLLAHYAGPVAVIVVAVLLIVVLPLTGLFWCCCYWCRVGRRRRPFDRKYDACLKGLLAIILIALLTLFLFGVVCAFATEAQVETGAAELSQSLDAGINDTQEFLNATQAHARWLLVNNFDELKIKLTSMLYGIGVTASVKLGEFSRAVSVTTLNKMVQQLDEVQDNLRTVHVLTAQLRLKADHLNTGLRKVKNQLLQTLAKCDQPKCRALQDKYKIGQLDTEIQYSQMLDKYFPTMPDVTDLLGNVTELLDSDIKGEVAAGQKVFSDIQRGIQRSVDKHVPEVVANIEELGRQLARAADDISAMAGNASARLEQARGPAAAPARLHARWGGYRRAAGLGAAAALLLVTCLAAWGVLCGVCGKRPDVYGASDCCNKGHGSRSLLCGMGAMFVLGSGVTLVLLVYFVLGLAAQRFVCDPLTEPRDNRLFSDLEQVVDLEGTLFGKHEDPNFNMAYALVRCHKNATLYSALQLHRLLNVPARQAGVRAEVATRLQRLQPLLPRGAAVSILRPAARDKLRRLADAGLSDFQFERILAALETNMTSLALDSLARQLNATARSLQQPLFQAEAASLLRASAALADLLHDVLEPMLHDSARLNITATKLRDGLRFNHSSLKDAVTYLMHETSEAEVFLNTQGPERLQNMTAELGLAVARKLEQYMSRLEAGARQDVGRCGPLSGAYNATLGAACRKLLLPAHGYWLALAWCLLLFAPLLAVSGRLARLYRHVDPYPGPLVEAAYKAEKRSGREPRDGREAREAREARDGRGRGPRAAAPLDARAARHDAALAPPLDAYHARRYNDMAPKHWEEGPPRYLGSTEYERPPPYYYPGPNPRARSLPGRGRGCSWAQYLADSPGVARRSSLRDMDVVAAQQPARRPPGFSWAEYLRTSPSTLQSTVGESSRETLSTEASTSSREPPRKWAEYLGVVGPSQPKQVNNEVKPESSRGQPQRPPGASSWAEYLAARYTTAARPVRAALSRLCFQYKYTCLLHMFTKIYI
ncbi:prominin-like protein isoform X4 [Spodoptera frugiperda]|uniref:Prominin-like protein isoform X4 n=1 Tax=Spodoptera frugiperda TaxID=7108 RepID=A0A9R0E7R1_SPOFR|nr:prominin-like protein isoform X4 [Spodoptera frugiperda]